MTINYWFVICILIITFNFTFSIIINNRGFTVDFTIFRNINKLVLQDLINNLYLEK